MVMKQALMSALIIVQMIYEAALRHTMVEQGMATATGDDEAAAEEAAAKKTTDVASIVAVASNQREQTGSGATAAVGVRRKQTKKQMKQVGQEANVEQQRAFRGCRLGVEQQRKQAIRGSRLSRQSWVSGQSKVNVAAAAGEQKEQGKRCSSSGREEGSDWSMGRMEKTEQTKNVAVAAGEQKE